LHCNGKTYSTKKVAGYSATCKDGKAKLVNTKKCYARGACEGKKKMTGEKFFDVFPEMSFIAGVFPNKERVENIARFACKDGMMHCTNKNDVLKEVWRLFKPYPKFKGMYDAVVAFQNKVGGDGGSKFCDTDGDAKDETVAGRTQCANEIMSQLENPDMITKPLMAEFKKAWKKYMEDAEIAYNKDESSKCVIDNPEHYKAVPETWSAVDVRGTLEGLGALPK
jgi:hypothetical protein